jgi:hypothetical protein
MKNKLYINFIILILSKSVLGQNKCFTIHDSINSTAISYANIWQNNKIYANSDANGKFCIKAVDLNAKFTISCIGYITKPVDLNSNTIYLDKDNVNLKEVVVNNPKRKQKIQLGKTSGTTIGIVATYDLIRAEIGKSFVLNQEKQFYLKEVKFKTSTYEEGRTMGLKIYSLNDNNEPDQLIFAENIILTLKKGTNITTYSFEDNLIPVPKNGFFISLQMLLIEENKQYGTSGKLVDYFFYDPSVGATTNVEEELCFTQQQEGVWAKMKNIDLNIKVFLTD